MTNKRKWSAGRALTRQASLNERLLEDMGLTREQAYGRSRAFWSEWRRVREPWQL